jgi:hypothetical protein
MGKMFQNASSLKPLGQLKPNCPGMIIGRSSTNFLFFYANRKFKMAAVTNNRNFFKWPNQPYFKPECAKI